jgi:hypothetical protein
MSDIDTILRQIKPRVISWIHQDLLISGSAGSSGVTDHGLLTGLGDDDHTQYVHVSTARSITAQHTFAPVAPQAPFALNANAQGRLVTGLYADQLSKSVSVSGLGLSGGGALTADRTITLASSSNPGPAPSILATDGAGLLGLTRLNTPIIGTTGLANLTLSPNGSVIFDPTSNDVLPNTNYITNMGSISKKYLTLWAAELWVETLVAQDVIATVGGHILVAPTTLLVEDCAAGDTHIHVKHNNLANGDRVYLNSTGKIEWMAVASAPIGGVGNYLYTVTRNLDGSGANDWYAGDAVLNTGTTGDGYIDIYSVSSIRSGTQYGPTIVGTIRFGTTYSDLIEGWAIGNLEGLYGYGTGTPIYGVGLGRYGNGFPNIVVDPTNGIRIRNYTSDIIHFDTSGNAEITGTMSVTGSLTAGAGVVILNTNGIQIDVPDATLPTITGSYKFYHDSALFAQLYGVHNTSGVFHTAGFEMPLFNGINRNIFISCAADSTHNATTSLQVSAAGMNASLDVATDYANTLTRITLTAGHTNISGGLYVGSTSATCYADDILADGGIYIGSGVSDPEAGRIYTAHAETLTADQTDDYAASLRLAPTYSAISVTRTVARHNYITLVNVAVLGTAVVTDAAAMYFNAAIGTHKAIDSGTTKTSPGTVTAWMKVNLNGVIHYIPCYSSKTS